MINRRSANDPQVRILYSPHTALQIGFSSLSEVPFVVLGLEPSGFHKSDAIESTSLF